MLPTRNTLNVGAQLRAEGLIERFNGELQVSPGWPEQITVITPAYAGGQLVPTGQLNNYKGQRVMIEGTVVDFFQFDTGHVVMTLDDGSGQGDVYIWSNIYNRIPNKGAVSAIGSNIRVVGVVDEFNGQPQVQPALPYDVVLR